MSSEESLWFEKTVTSYEKSEDGFDFREVTGSQSTQKECEKIDIEVKDSENPGKIIPKTAYIFKELIDSDKKELDDNIIYKLFIYSKVEGKDGSDEKKAINEDNWCIRLNLKNYKNSKKDSVNNGNTYIYINFIRTLRPCSKDLKDVFFTIYEIAMKLGITYLYLQDQAEFPCDQQYTYGLRALYVRSLDVGKNWDALSIYNTYGFIPDNQPKQQVFDLKKNIDKLRSITCNQIFSVAGKLKKVITNILHKNDIEYTLKRVSINKDDFSVSFSDIPENRYTRLCTDYIKNLDKILATFHEGGNRPIYYFYKSKEKNCNKLRDIMDCLKSSVNSYVIIIKGNVPYGSPVSSGRSSPVSSRRGSPRSSSPPPASSGGPSRPVRVGSEESLDLSKNITDNQVIISTLFNMINVTFEVISMVYSNMVFTDATEDKLKGLIQGIMGKGKGK